MIDFKQALADIFRLFQLAELEMRAENQRELLENESQWTQNLSPELFALKMSSTKQSLHNHFL